MGGCGMIVCFTTGPTRKQLLQQRDELLFMLAALLDRGEIQCRCEQGCDATCLYAMAKSLVAKVTNGQTSLDG